MAGKQKEKYEYIIETRVERFALIYNYVGRTIQIKMGKIREEKVKAFWFNPRNGETTFINNFENSGIKEFDPPREMNEGNDWVLLLETLQQ